jgi:hypothetical protein
VIGGVAVSQLDAAGNQNFAGFMRAANIQVGGPIFTLSRSATTSFIVFDTAVNAFLQYDSPSGQLGFFIGAVPKFTVDGAGNGNFAGTLTAANITPSDGSVTTAKLAANSVTTPKIADANVTAAKLAAGAAVANIGYTPTNKAGDTITGAFGVTGNLSVGGSVSVGAGSQVSLSSDGATFTQVMLHAATNFFLRLDWATGKLTYFTNNVAVMSIDAGGTIRATNFLLAPP